MDLLTMLNIFVIDFDCSTGYTKKVGRMGGGDGGLGKVISGISSSECKHECDLDMKCKSYFFSEQISRCKLQNELLPLLNDTFKDYIWCSKSRYNTFN